MAPNFAILVLSCKIPLYQEFKAAQQTSWVRTANRCGVPVYFCEGVGSIVDPNDFLHAQVDFDGAFDLNINCEDSLRGSFIKTLASLNYIFSNSKVDFVFRTNLSSYLDIISLIKYIQKHRFRSNLYAGVVGEARLFPELCYLRERKIATWLVRSFDCFSKKIHFASGAGFFISRDVFVNGVQQQKKFLNLIDDVAIGYNFDIDRDFVLPLERCSLSLQDFEEGRLESVDHKKFRDRLSFHYRCKNSFRNLDVELIKQLGNYFGDG